jgi:hypothetical protein
MRILTLYQDPRANSNPCSCAETDMRMSFEPTHEWSCDTFRERDFHSLLFWGGGGSGMQRWQTVVSGLQYFVKYTFCWIVPIDIETEVPTVSVI